jgi:hypothetical protein
VAAQQARLVSATSVVADGYVVEASIDLLEGGGPNSYIGVDFQVNDASGGARIGMRNWADATNAGYLSTSHWGVGRLAPDTTVPVINVPATLDLTATTWFGYQGYDASVAGVTASDAFDPPSALEITSDAPATLPIGTTVVTWTVTDPAGNSSSAQQMVTVHRRIHTAVLYSGSFGTVVTKSSSFKASAFLFSYSSSCRAGMPITFTLNRDPVTGESVPTELGTVNTNSRGYASLTVPSQEWRTGWYYLTISYAGNNLGCLPSSTTVPILVWAPARWWFSGHFFGHDLALSADRPVAIQPPGARL